MTLLATDFNCDDVAKEVRGKGREINLNRGGRKLKLNKNKLHRFYFCRKYGSKRIRDLKGHLTKLTLILTFTVFG